MLDKWKQAIVKGEYVSVTFMDLSKVFDTINHDLLLTNLKTYSFSRVASDHICSYLRNRRQSVVINNIMSSAGTVIAEVPQGSIKGLPLLNLFINDLILFLYTTVLSYYVGDMSLARC